MRKATLLILITLILGGTVLLSSCFGLIGSTHKMSIDDTLADEGAVVKFVGWFQLKKWNDRDIEEDLYKKKSIWSNDKTILTVPSGFTSFTFFVGYIISGNNTSTTYRFDDIELQYLLEAGKKYNIEAFMKSKGFLKGYEFIIGIYDVTGKKTMLKEWKLGET